jgi:DNA sulfur modification protein DndE
MTIEHIRLSQQARDQLLKLKRLTGIRNWNVLCRWGFCVSLAEPTMPSSVRVPADSSVEMTWKVFGGEHADIYQALLAARCQRDGLPCTAETLAAQFRLHLHRGISYLASDKRIKNVAGLFARLPSRSTAA